MKHSKGALSRCIVRESSPATLVSILKGVLLHLTWDRKLLSVEVNPKELKLRDKALKFVGISEDEAKDTAEHHNDYLAGSPINA